MLTRFKKIKSDDKPEKKNSKAKKAKGKGFDAIAGMKELKAQLKLDVIDAYIVLEEYANMELPFKRNAVIMALLVAGKTFFAKHFAEEVAFNFMLATQAL